MQHVGDSGRLSVRIGDKTYAGANANGVQAIEELAFVAAAKSCTALVGPSGCGKTTILKIIAGLDRRFTGAVTLGGVAVPSARIGFVFQEPTLLPWRSLEDNVRLAAPDLSEDALEHLLRQAEIEEFRGLFPGELSLGLARRASIVRALASRPDLLLLDEPFVSLDAATAKKLRALIARILDAGPVTALLVTHDLREAVELADRIIMLTPRPARVKSQMTIGEPRAERSAAIVKKHLNRIEKAAKAN